MYLASFDDGFFVPMMIFAVPIVAIAGGITAGIVRTVSRHRLIELAQRERIAAIERGVDPSKLPPLPTVPDTFDRFGGMGELGGYNPLRRAQGLMVGGLVTLAVGVGLGVFLHLVADEPGVWAVGAIPGAIGVALLLSALIVWPRGGSSGGGQAPPMH